MIQLGCDLGQGYGIARPMPAEAVPGWVAGFSAPESWRRAGLHPWSRDDFPLLGASIDHQHWIEELVQCLEQDTSHRPPPLDIHHRRFGRWYHGPGQDRYGQLPAFRVIDASHHQVHELASQLHAAHLAGELARAHGIPELYPLRDQMLAQLDALRRWRQPHRRAGYGWAVARAEFVVVIIPSTGLAQCKARAASAGFAVRRHQTARRSIVDTMSIFAIYAYRMIA